SVSASDARAKFDRAVTKIDICAKIQSVGLIPAVRVSTPEDATLAADAVSRGGIPIVELTMTVPKAAELITDLLKKQPHMIVSSGTVLNIETARAFLYAGAKLI